MTVAPATRRKPWKQNDILMIKQYRIECPWCGELPDGPFPCAVDANAARQAHWRIHRDER